MNYSMFKIGFGGGCHWCTEAVFQTLLGVCDVAQGFISSCPPDNSWSEAVIVSYDQTKIPLSILIEIHLRTHASNSPHKMRGKYRSAVYVFDETQRIAVESCLQDLRACEQLGTETRVLDYVDFKPSDDRYINYYLNAPEKPFCVRYIDPKLTMMRSKYADYLRDADDT